MSQVVKKHLLSSVTTNGQTTVPVEIRRHLDLSPGDHVFYEIEEGSGKVVLRKVAAIVTHDAKVAGEGSPKTATAK